MVFVYHDYRVRNLCKYSQASQEGTVSSRLCSDFPLASTGNLYTPSLPMVSRVIPAPQCFALPPPPPCVCSTFLV